MKLALVDRNTDTLAQAKTVFEKDEAKTETYAMDVSQPNEWKDLRSKVESNFSRVDFLMLNAATILKGEWDDMMYFQKVRSRLLPSISLAFIFDLLRPYIANAARGPGLLH